MLSSPSPDPVIQLPTHGLVRWSLPIRWVLGYLNSPAPHYAPAIAFNAFIAIFPITLGLVTLLVITSPGKLVTREVEHIILDAFPVGTRADIGHLIYSAVKHPKTLGSGRGRPSDSRGAMAAWDSRYMSNRAMRTESRPATPEQVRLLIGLSSLSVLPMVAFVMVYLTVHQTVPDHAPAWRAFAVALAVGACLGGVFVRFFPVFGGSLPSRPSVRTVLPILAAVSLIVVIWIGRLTHQAVPVTMGFVAGTDAVLAIVLLLRSLRGLSQITTPRQ